MATTNKGSRRYWLFKTEPDCFGLVHLKAQPKQTSSWDGVRNYQSRNYLRDEIGQGDGVFFYHSSCPVTGIAGICQVVRPGYPDHTGWDPNGQHFDPKASAKNPIWYMVDVQFRLEFSAVLPLTALKVDKRLAKMMVTQRGSRLSIQPVTSAEWQVVLELAGVEDPLR